MEYRRRQQDIFYDFRDTAGSDSRPFPLILCDRERPLCAVLAPRAAESRSQKHFPLPPPPARALRSHKIYCVLRVKYVVRIAAIYHTPFFGIRLACAEDSSPTPHIRSI